MLAVITVGIGYSWVAAGLHPFTWPMRVATAVPVVVALVLACRRADVPRPSRTARIRLGLWVWGTLLALLVAWELIAYVGSPRHDHPTLSSIAEPVMSWHATRAAVFAAWLAVGAGLLRPFRAARS